MKYLKYEDNEDGTTTIKMSPVTYKNIYAAVNKVKPCRFTVKNGVVKFELIETPEDAELVLPVEHALQDLGVAYHRAITKTYNFDGNTQWRTNFRVEK